MSKKAVLLINLGTPDNCDPASVRSYLKEFLNDPRVVDLPFYQRWPLVNLLIVPFRYKKTAALYQKIWNSGSPLLFYSERMKDELAKVLGGEYQVELGMRYGNPSIQSALEKFKDCDSLQVIPLFPQYSSAATGSAIEELLEVVSAKWNVPSLKITNNFFDHPGFISAYAEVIRNNIENKNIDMVLFSYHGLPERQINKSGCVANCDRENACPEMCDVNQYCYRAQCYATTELIANELGLSSDQFKVSFQSRLGRTPWIKPYTDVLLPELAQKGVKNIAMVSPSFVADCLETLEEINIRTLTQWHELGGKEFIFVPCINDSPLWIKALADIVQK